MKNLARIVVLCATSAALLVPAMASADVATCQTDISNLRAATLTAAFSGQNAVKDRDGLVAKLDNASTALAAGKNDDAIQKLTDYRNKVVTLGDSGKLAASDASALVAGADDAIACIRGLTTT
jgi:hypothetical protein